VIYAAGLFTAYYALRSLAKAAKAGPPASTSASMIETHCAAHIKDVINASAIEIGGTLTLHDR
jgi:hypothetical protein